MAHLGPGGAIAVKQRVGRDSEEASRRERCDTQCQSQLQIDGARVARHEIEGLLHALFHSPAHLEADFGEKKAGQARSGISPGQSWENLHFAREADRTIWGRSGFPRSGFPRVHPCAELLSSSPRRWWSQGSRSQLLTNRLRRPRSNWRFFPSSWKILARLRPIFRPTISTASNCGFRQKRRVG